MKKTIALTFTLLLTAAFALTQTSLASQEGEVKKKADKTTKAAAAPKTAAPKSDPDVQKCISDKLAASKTVGRPRRRWARRIRRGSIRSVRCGRGSIPRHRK